MPQLLRPLTSAAIAVALLVGAAGLPAFAQDEPKADAAAPAAPKIDPKADAVLKAASQLVAGKQAIAVRSVQSINVSGPGINQQQQVANDIAFRRPNLFSFDVKQNGDGARVVSDGQKMVTFVTQFGKYVEADAPKSLEKLDASDNPIIASIAPMALFIALEDPHASIVKGVTAVEYVGQEKIDEADCDRLRFSVDLQTMIKKAMGGAAPPGAPQGVVTIDAWIASGDRPLLRRLTPDMAALMKAMAAGAQGAQAQMLAQMKFEMVINYDQWRFGDDVAADAFAFKPPADAQKVASVQEVFAAAAGGGADPAAALKGKPAPQFELELLDQEGKATLAAHKDKQIVILDFWATWCGPCVRALPILEKVAKEYKSKGVVFYAVNQREDPAQVRQFMKQREFSFTVAMDAQGRVGNLFQVQGIPQTVIIAPDGKVHEVHVGFSPNLEQTLRAELDALIEEFKPKAN